jgi:hypothetical protein
MTMLALTDVRAQAATALAPAAEGDPYVHIGYVDSVEPPAIVLVWGDPWLTPMSVGTCYFDAQLEVMCVAARIEPEPNIAKLEEMVGYVIAKLGVDPDVWPVASLQAPRITRIGDMPYLTARVTYTVQVTTNGGP